GRGDDALSGRVVLSFRLSFDRSARISQRLRCRQLDCVSREGRTAALSLLLVALDSAALSLRSVDGFGLEVAAAGSANQHRRVCDRSRNVARARRLAWNADN